jgi:acid phosphatase family membrane protein YuiD
MNFSYAVTPFIAWLLAGSIKFIINSIKARRLAFGQIGYGGLPSNHSAIVNSIAALIAIREGIDHPAFGVAVALAFVVLLDANSLRNQVGRQATAINKLVKAKDMIEPLRERMGHSRIEILAGIFVGVAAAWLVDTVAT